MQASEKRRGKESNLRGLNPIAYPPARPPPKTRKTFRDELQLQLDLTPLHPLALTGFQSASGLAPVSRGRSTRRWRAGGRQRVRQRLDQTLASSTPSLLAP